MREFEIRQVANGFMVMPTIHRGNITPMGDVYVFKTWAQASAWIRKQLEQK